MKQESKTKSIGMLNNLVIEKESVLSQDISFYREQINIDWPEREGEYYRLLTYITKNTNGIRIIDAGTYGGFSCLAFCQNENNMVYTYDIERKDIDFLSKKENVIMKHLDINAEEDSNILCCSIILLDLDPHDGLQEKAFSDRLERINYNGFLICDNININYRMRTWWDSILVPKYEISDIAHIKNGTGIACYNTSITIV